MTTPIELPDIEDTELASIAMAIAELLVKLDQAAPRWRMVVLERGENGEASVRVFDGAEEELLQ